jgi:hypothetical protein
VITGDYEVGGLIGNGWNSVIIQSSVNEGIIVGKLYYVGGLIGYVRFATTITKSINLAKVSTGSSVGGLIGFVDSNLTIVSAFNIGDIEGGQSVGGLVGYVSGITNISNSFNNGNIEGSSNVGGLIGRGSWSSTTISFSANYGDVAGANIVGGLIGQAGNSGHKLYVYNSVQISDVTASSFNSNQIGGIAGVLPSVLDFDFVYHFGIITSNGVAVDGVSFGTKVIDISTFNLAFFTTTLGWDTEVWDFTGLDIANGIYPTLKNMPTIEE